MCMCRTCVQHRYAGRPHLREGSRCRVRWQSSTHSLRTMRPPRPRTWPYLGVLAKAQLGGRMEGVSQVRSEG